MLDRDVLSGVLLIQRTCQNAIHYLKQTPLTVAMVTLGLSAQCPVTI